MPAPASPSRRPGGGARARAAGALSAAAAAALLVAALPTAAAAADGSAGSGPGSTGSGPGSAGSLGSVDPSGSMAAMGAIGSSGSTGMSSLASLGTLPQIPQALQNNDPDIQPPLPLQDPPVTQVAVTKVEGTDWGDLAGNPRFERWWVSSPAMNRIVPVELWFPADRTTPSPVLYLLDGVDSPYPSGWYTAGNIRQVFDHDQVTLVAVQGAVASLYADWQREDPVLLRNKWETFLTEELPQVIEHGPVTVDGQEHSVAFNGTRGIAGLSMGAASVVDIAVHHPGRYSAVGAISGCYDPSHDLGFLLAKVTAETRGGDIANLWGPSRTTPVWQEHNSLLHIGALKGTPLFFSSATGIPAADAWTAEYNRDPVPFVQGAVLEQGVHACTLAMDDALTAAGMRDDATIDYKPTGMHNWANFAREIQPMHDVLMPALRD